MLDYEILEESRSDHPRCKLEIYCQKGNHTAKYGNITAKMILLLIGSILFDEIDWLLPLPVALWVSA